MRPILLVLAAAFVPATGCKWVEDMRADQGRPPRGTGAIPPVSPEQLVGYLNDRARKLQSIEYGNTRMVCYDKGIRLPATLDGNLACSQPRSFRMVGSGRMAPVKIDLGSNDEQFWVYVAVPTEKPLYVFASHTDFETGKAPLPGGIPFEPSWVMQALGMTVLPPTMQYQVKTNEKDRTYTLYWTAATPNGQQVTKEIVFEADTATGNRSQIRQHVVKNLNGKVICVADIKSAKTLQPAPGEVAGPLAQYPTHVSLKWLEQRFEMDLTLENATVNQAPNADRAGHLFSRPKIANVPAVDLAKYEFFNK